MAGWWVDVAHGAAAVHCYRMKRLSALCFCSLLAACGVNKSQMEIMHLAPVRSEQIAAPMDTAVACILPRLSASSQSFAYDVKPWGAGTAIIARFGTLEGQPDKMNAWSLHLAPIPTGTSVEIRATPRVWGGLVKESVIVGIIRACG